MAPMVIRKHKSVAEEIRDLALKHHVAYKPGPYDGFARTMGRLAGNDVSLDKTGKLIIALQRAGVITRDKAVLLTAEHMRQASL